ncbi:hypothetical protein ELH93_19550 [Rhizobium leguminosarum]|uniref:hypothetical protein n=1 Tax=Rhizobium leguminosarum TaxID=384 RepID=UPI0010313248|nr:hypothetical protein [Rhizobium leguminosarum]TAY34678.1 hypothetical protein ELH93_19550 [Rhizobium leguminosarum]
MPSLGVIDRGSGNMRWGGAIVAVIVAVGAAAALYIFSGDKLRDIVNAHWPPAAPVQQRQAAIKNAIATLDAMHHPNLAAGTDVKTIELIASEKLKERGLTKVSLETDDQLLKISAAFDVTLRPEDVNVDAQKKEWIAKLKPRVVGRLEAFLSASAVIATSPKYVLQVKLLPAFKSIHVDRITLADRYEVGAAGELLAAILNSYADNVTGSLATAPILSTELPASFQDQFDPTGAIKVAAAADSKFKLSISSKPISSPYRLNAAALLIDGGKVVVLAQISPRDEIVPKAAAGERSSLSDLNEAFNGKVSEGLGLMSLPEGVWAALGKELLASALNSAFAQSQVCLSGSGTIPKQTFAQKIPTPDPASIDCTPKTECAPTQPCDLQVDTNDCRRSRNCQLSVDTKDCSVCLARAPTICVPNFPKGQSCSGGQCIQTGNDPVCEGKKAAQNALYKADYKACVNLGPLYDAKCEADKAVQNAIYATAKAQCESQKAATRLACESSKTSLKAACETVKGAVATLHSTGNVGNLDGSASSTGDLSMCFRQVSLAKDLKKLTMKLESTGAVGIDTSFKFTPLDVAGHVLCALPWTAEKHIDVTVRRQAINVDLSLTKRAASPAYDGHLEGTSIALHFEPSPLSLILQNINFRLACPVASGLVNALTLDLAPFIPEMLKDYTHKIEPMDFSFTPDIPKQSLFGHTINPKLSETPKALVVSGAVAG